jgi:predicted phage-related endonuclease
MHKIIEITEEINSLSQWIVDNSNNIATARYNYEIAEAKAKELESVVSNEFKEEGTGKAKIIAASHPEVLKMLEAARPLRLEHLVLSTKMQSIAARLDALKSILMAELAILKHTTNQSF